MIGCGKTVTKNTRLEKTVSLPIEHGPEANPEALGLATVLLTKRLHNNSAYLL